MKKSIITFIGIVLFTIVQVFSFNGVAKAASFENGTYSVSFEIKEAGNNNTSIADGYFSKPAKLIIKNGLNYIQLTTTESEWVKSLSGPNGSSTVISENGNSRTVQFEVGDVSQPVNMSMHVVVPEDVAGMKYDHNHSVRAIFDVSSIPVTSTNSSNEQLTETNANDTKQGNESAAKTKEVVENPKTGDSSSIFLYIALLVGTVGIFAIQKMRVSKNN